ncbi:tripartite tricarboxylate transporter TctB family protein [Streptomonospora sp. PA3]|uniref:tripartite tricarboxylate transporter TctB family protein n=1 Tax=Streptomonospora sp. PA3 TaxID=2607326 RepID=UPI0012DD4EB9|nr:tripartite tricarboxylate transporter TctB family protein [Streptomonospora sp. PA3]MUL41744.1 tripartite tricarboxylate transporter TctB family protein [Streptomonospora sp. PA3]
MAKTPTSRVRLPFQRASAEQEADGAGDGRGEPDGARAQTGGGSGGSAAGRRPAVSGQTVFYLVLGALLTGYTAMAFGMEWQTTAGRVGPGLFPRIIGVLGVAACALCVVQSMRAARAADPAEQSARSGSEQAERVEQAGGARAAASTAQGEADTAEAERAGASAPAPAAPPAGGSAPADDEHRRHPWAVAALCGILALFVTVMVPVGAVITGSLALIAALLVCDRSHPVRSVVIGAAFPVVLYAVFVYGLNAQLPPGILPL